jgi:hypothetical protein
MKTIQIRTTSTLPFTGKLSLKDFQNEVTPFDFIGSLMSLQELSASMGNQVWVNINLEFEFHASRRVKHQILLSKDFVSFLAKQVILNCSQTDNQLNELDLVNLVYMYGNLEIDLHYLKPTEEDGWLWVLRATNHQWFYLRLPSLILGRYIHLFERVFADNDLKREVNQIFKIDLLDLLKIGISIYTGFSVTPDGRFGTSFEMNRYTKTEIKALKPLLAEENLNKFFNIFAIDKKRFTEKNKKYRLASPLLKKYEFNPLKRYPVIITDSEKQNEKYIIPSLSDFIYGTSEGIYYVLIDKLDKKNKGRLFDILGKAFERYIGELMRFYNVDLFSRAQLIEEQVYQAGRNQFRSADWLLISDQLIFQIECKKRKLNNYAKAGVESANGEGIKSFLRTVAQELDKFYEKENHIKQGLLKKITYKGQEFINIIIYLDEMFSINRYGRNEIKKHMKNKRDDFYILGCYEFEMLCQHTKNKSLNLERALKDLVTGKTEIYTIDYLDNIFHDFFDSLMIDKNVSGNQLGRN